MSEIYRRDADIAIRSMCESDIGCFTDAFNALGWGDRRETLTMYFDEQNAARRAVLVAENNEYPVGYLTVVPDAMAGPFAGRKLPEIKDFNVLPPFRRRGVGNLLMDCAEAVARETSEFVTLGVGLYTSYGSAQRMYVKRGYIPDGSGVWYQDRNIAPYEECRNDDDLILYFSKRL